MTVGLAMIDPLDLAGPIPYWAEWIAADADGAIWAYQRRPDLFTGAESWTPDHIGDCSEIGRQVPCTGWRWSLTPASTLERQLREAGGGSWCAMDLEALSPFRRHALVLGASLAMMMMMAAIGWAWHLASRTWP